MRRTITGFLVSTLVCTTAAAAIRQTYLAEAIRSQQRIVDARPNDSRALNDLGNLLTLAGELDEAEAKYREALVLAPEDAVIHYNLGLLLRQTGRHRSAMSALQKVVKLDPDDAWGHYQLATMLEAKSKRSRATEHFVEAFVLDPSLTELDVNPQLLESTLTTRAMMSAYAERVARAESAPRQYEQPKRITRLLLPESPPGEQPPAETSAGEGTSIEKAEGAEEEDAEPDQRRKRRRDKKKNKPTGGS